MIGRLPPAVTLGGAALIVVAGVLVALIFQPSQGDLESIFDSSGALGPVLYTAAYAALTVAFVPGLPLTLAAGALFGALGGAAVSIVGATIGATAAFLIARRGTRDSVEQVRGERLSAIEKRLEGKGFLALLTMRLIPVFPFNALNYAAGASPISTRDYVIATFFGIIPGAIAYSALGAGLDDPTSPLFIGAAAMAIALALGAKALSNRVGAELPEDSDS